MQELINKLADAAEKFRACIMDLSQEEFLTPINGWSSRDITAHLIGWNRITITGCRNIKLGKLPSYFDDEPNDFKNINAEFVELYFHNDQERLLGEFETSYLSVENFVQFLEPEDLEQDFGVRFGKQKITILSTVEDLIQDYDNHRREIESWSASSR